MMRPIHKLSYLTLPYRQEGLHGDGGGLILQVTRGVSGLNHSWLFRYVSPVTGKERRMGLGVYPTVSLDEAREKAATARKQVAWSKDPLDERAYLVWFAKKRSRARKKGREERHRYREQAVLFKAVMAELGVQPEIGDENG